MSEYNMTIVVMVVMVGDGGDGGDAALTTQFKRVKIYIQGEYLENVFILSRLHF